MKSFGNIFLVLIMLPGVQCLAGDAPFYRDFLSASSGKRPPFQITSTAVVDTNNCSPTVRGKPISLAPGELGGVRLGMSMDEVVALWGKPLAIGCCRRGQTSFTFGDVWFRFEGNQVYEIGLYASRPWTPQFAGGLVPISRKEEWIRFLGQPTSEQSNIFGISLCFDTNHTLTTLSFNLQDKQLSGVTIRRPRRSPASDIDR